MKSLALFTLPERKQWLESSLIVAIIVCATITMFVPEKTATLAIIYFIAGLSVAVFLRHIQLFHICLFFLLWYASLGLFPELRIWPWSYLVALIAYLLFVVCIPSLRRTIVWFQLGKITKFGLGLALLIVVFASISLVVWYYVTDPELAEHRKLTAQVSPAWFPLAAIAFAMTNAALEEVIFRGIVQQSLDYAIGPGIIAITIQGFSFGALHYLAGFPNGLLGVVMTFVYGCVLAYLRLQSQGLFIPWLTHVMADFTIALLLFYVVLEAA